MTNLDKLYGYIISHTNQQQVFAQIKPEWNVLQVHKDWYNAISELYKDNTPVDLVSINQKLRDHKKWSKESMLRTSQATTIATNGLVYVDTLLTEIDYEYKVRKMQLIQQEMTGEINGGNMSVNKVIELCDNAKGLLIDNTNNDALTNQQVIFDVVERHNKAKKGEPIGIELGWTCTKNKIILEEIDVMIVGGRPAMGKTAWMISAIKRLAFDQNRKIAVFSLEMSTQQLMRRLLANLTGINSERIRLGQCTESEIDKIYQIQSQPEFDNITFFDGSHSVLDITNKVTQLKNSGGIDVYLIDYLQKIIPSKAENRYQEVTKISNDIKRLTMGMKIPCIALAQLSRDSARQGKRPTLPDLKESGEIEQDASIVCFLHRPEYYGVTHDEEGNDTSGTGEFLIAKNREGVTGVIDMDVDLKLSGWYDPRAFTQQPQQETEQNPHAYQTSLNRFGHGEEDDETPF